MSDTPDDRQSERARMADQADERLKALKASMKEALGKVTGSDELEAQGAREKSGIGRVERVDEARAAPPAKKRATPRAAKARPPR